MKRSPSRPVIPRLAALLALLASVLALCGCGANERPLRIGLNAWPGYEFLFLAEVQGYYKRRGVDVRLVEFGSLSDARVALERGQIDGLGTTVVEVLMARAHRKGAAQIVRVVDYSDGADVIIARRELEHVNQLRGRRVGVELGSLGVYVLSAALMRHGLTLSDVTTVSQDQATMVAALERGSIDAIVTYPPESLRALRLEAARQVFSTAEIPGEVVDVLAFREEVLRQRPADVDRVLAAFDDALELFGTHQQLAARIMAAREGLSPEEFTKALTEGMHLVGSERQAEYFAPGGKLSKVVQNTADLLVAMNQIARADGALAAIRAPAASP